MKVDSHGRLLIGGMTLPCVYVELEDVEPLEEAGDWRLSGRMHVTPEDCEELELDRQYRLQLQDGRSGHIVLTSVEPHGADFLASFSAKSVKPR